MSKTNGAPSRANPHDLAEAYIESALKAQERAGSPTQVSKHDYDVAVKRAEAALRDVLPKAA